MKKDVLRISIVISCLLHLVLTAVVWIQPSLFIMEAPIPQPTQVDIVDADEILKQLEEAQKNGQIVTQSEQAVNNEIDKNAKFLSKNNQKIEKQTQAELNGAFRNATGQSGPEKQEQQAGESDQATQQPTLQKNNKKLADQAAPMPSPNEEKLADAKEQATEEDANDSLRAGENLGDVWTDPDGLQAPLTLDRLKPDFKPRPLPMGRQASGGGDGPSATDDHLDNVKKGMQTLLSTREFVYYSYYNRIKEKLRQYWEPKIKEKMARILRQGRTIASDDRITKVVIILDKSGTLVRVQVVGASGLVDLDEAAVEAFRAAAPFPNPPKGIVEKDGLIRIRWDFVLEARESVLRSESIYASL